MQKNKPPFRGLEWSSSGIEFLKKLLQHHGFPDEDNIVAVQEFFHIFRKTTAGGTHHVRPLHRVSFGYAELNHVVRDEVSVDMNECFHACLHIHPVVAEDKGQQVIPDSSSRDRCCMPQYPLWIILSSRFLKMYRESGWYPCFLDVL